MAKAQPNRVKAETLSLRISPELKFGLELLSRIEERSLTTQVEKALRELLLLLVCQLIISATPIFQKKFLVMKFTF